MELLVELKCRVLNYGDRKHNIDAVFNNKMWYSAPVRFNDPYDCDFAIDEPATIDSLLRSIAYTNNMKL